MFVDMCLYVFVSISIAYVCSTYVLSVKNVVNFPVLATLSNPNFNYIKLT